MERSSDFLNTVLVRINSRMEMMILYVQYSGSTQFEICLSKKLIFGRVCNERNICVEKNI